MEWKFDKDEVGKMVRVKVNLRDWVWKLGSILFDWRSTKGMEDCRDCSTV